MKKRVEPIPSSDTVPSSLGSPDVTRRKFLASAGIAAAGLTFIKPELVRGTDANSRINLGVVGCGGRGSWIADLFVKNGNFNLVTIADYFQDRVDSMGSLDVFPTRIGTMNPSVFLVLVVSEFFAP